MCGFALIYSRVMAGLKPLMHSKPMPAVHKIYKICDAILWREAERIGMFHGSPVDRRDGFIHFSTSAQVVETAAKHFAGIHDLLLVHVNTAALGNLLNWEPSRGGALFPHLYGDLDLTAVIRIEPLPLGADGKHRIPLLDGTH